MLGHIDPLEAREAAHPDVIELGEQKGVDEMPAIDGEFRIIDCLLRDLKPGWTRAEKTAAASPIQLHLRLARAGHQVRQIEAEKIMSFDDIGIAVFDDGRETFERSPL